MLRLSGASRSPHTCHSPVPCAARGWRYRTASRSGCQVRGGRRRDFLFCHRQGGTGPILCLGSISFVSLGGFPSWTTARCASHSTGERAANPTSWPRRKVWHPRRHASLIEYDFPQSRVGRVTAPVKPKRYGTVTRPEPSEHSGTRGGNRHVRCLVRQRRRCEPFHTFV